MRAGRISLLAVLATGVSGAGKTPRPLHEKSFAEILKSYTFVGDFEMKDPERPISDELFWRYPYPLPKVEFPLIPGLQDAKIEMPATKGEGRAIDHLNRGRILYLEGKREEAKATWLSARARYGKEFPLHRRNDYFIGQVFMGLADADMKARGVPFADAAVKSAYGNAATFLSWAFIVKEDQPDPLVDLMAPKGLYNLAAIYWKYDRYAGAFGAAEKALNFLRRTGRRELRPQFRRFAAEAYIKNRTYLEAVQELDAAIRQDPDPKEAAASFARVGDIYFDLNNYELAEDSYALGAKIDEDERRINPAQLVLRGESLFWLGKFSEAQKMLHFALEGGLYRDASNPIPDEMKSYAALRIADSYLALKDYEHARLEYYKVRHAWRNSAAGRMAAIREACLELPYYKGNNVKHARELLEGAKAGPEIPPLAQELAWACQVGSYTDRERTPDMLDRVATFAGSYPESRFLRSFTEPVREFQASRIDEYFTAGDGYRALSFFEKNRKLLFPKVNSELAKRLFEAYVDVHRSQQAAEFWDVAHKETADTDVRSLREAVVAAELAGKKGAGSIWEKRDKAHALALAKREWKLAPSKLAAEYVTRIVQSENGDRHLPWLTSLAKGWGAKETDYVCDLEYPLLSKTYELRPEARGRVTARITELITQTLPALFKQDESCALSLLELEARALRTVPTELADRYVKRAGWPLVGGFLHTFWTVSEHLHDDGDKASAKKMWNVIKDKGPPESPEVQFAKARLDPEKTEFERLWD